MSDYIQLIGHALQAQCPATAKKSLLYAEVADDVISCDILFETAGGELELRFASHGLRDLTYEFWEAGTTHVPPRSWRAMEYVLVHAQLRLDFAYPNQLNEEESEHERRPRAIARHFPGLQVNYSRPYG